MKRPGFYKLQVIMVSSNFSTAKQLNKIKNTCEHGLVYKIRPVVVGHGVNIMSFLNFDLLELDIRDSYKKSYCDYVSFRFLRMCFQVLQFLQYNNCSSYSTLVS